MSDNKSLTARIKREAQRTGAKIQTHDQNKVDQILNKLFYLDKKVDEEAEFVKSVMTRGTESQERKGFHASHLLQPETKFCYMTAVTSLYTPQAQGEVISTGLKRIFAEGDAIHEKWQRLLIRGGYTSAELLDVTQMNKQYRVKYTPDVICTIPDVFNSEPFIIEIKSVNTFQFKKGNEHAQAKKQVNLYMNFTGIQNGMVLQEDKNTQEFRVDLYNYDESVIKKQLIRAERVKQIYKVLYKQNKLPQVSKIDVNNDRCLNCKNGLPCEGLSYIKHLNI